MENRPLQIEKELSDLTTPLKIFARFCALAQISLKKVCLLLVFLKLLSLRLLRVSWSTDICFSISQKLGLVPQLLNWSSMVAFEDFLGCCWYSLVPCELYFCMNLPSNFSWRLPNCKDSSSDEGIIYSATKSEIFLYLLDPSMWIWR